MNSLDKLGKIYHPRYHDIKNIGSFNAARKILPILFHAFKIQSVVDFGCAAGTWLAAAKELGATDLTGIEGSWADNWVNDTIISRNDFSLVLQNLEEPVRVTKEYDLAVSLETAEHLRPRRAETFVEDLCAASKKILFSAAIPGQGGNNHFNEQWPSYWTAIFLRFCYVPVDCIRPRIWSDDTIPWWYRQNCLLYVKESDLERVRLEINSSLPPLSGPLDIVHPELFLQTQTSCIRSLKANRFPISLFRALWRRLRMRQ